MCVPARQRIIITSHPSRTVPFPASYHSVQRMLLSRAFNRPSLYRSSLFSLSAPIASTACFTTGVDTTTTSSSSSGLHHEHNDYYDVLISGGGVVGASLAASLLGDTKGLRIGDNVYSNPSLSCSLSSPFGAHHLFICLHVVTTNFQA